MNSIELVRKMLRQVDPSGRSKGLQESLKSQSRRSSETRVEGVAPHSTAEATMESVDALRRGDVVSSDQQYHLEAIVLPFHRPVVDVVDDYIVKDQLTSTWDKLGDDSHRGWIKERVRAIGRINVPNQPSLPYAGTGFVVGDGLLMTNRHVANIFAQGLGTRTVKFQSGQTATIDFYCENGSDKSESLTVERVVMIHPHWDMAILKVNGLSRDRVPLKLSTVNPATIQENEVVVVGYPGYDPKSDQEFQRVQNRIFRGTYYVKRFQPGLLKVREQIESFGHDVDAITHDCSTLGGNSGSTVIDIDSGNVIGLHFAGAYLVANYAVPTYELAQDSRVVDAGLNFVGRLEPRGDFYGPIWTRIDAAESVATTDQADPGPLKQSPSTIGSGVNSVTTTNSAAVTSSMTWTIPINVTISIGTPVTVVDGKQTPLRTTPAERVQSNQHVEASTGTTPQFSVSSLNANQFGWPTALSLVMASQLVYKTESEVKNTAIGNWGLNTCKLIDAEETQCFVASTNDVVLVSFRGTQSVGDWLTNLNIFATNRPYGQVHSGFFNAFNLVDDELRAEIGRFAGRPVVLTGHSLGGALATIAAAEWKQRGVKISSMYTYGQPAVGKGDFPTFFQQSYPGKLIRFVNNDDIVPRVPPTYRHVGDLYQFDGPGNIKITRQSSGNESLSVAAESAADPTRGMLTEQEFDELRLKYLEQKVQRQRSVTANESVVEEGLIPSVSDHHLENYIAKITAQLNKS